MNQKQKMVTGSFVLLFIFSVAICTAMNMLNVIIPLYVTETLKGTAATAGLMTTVYTVSACVSRPVNGVLTDRIGRRIMMAVGSVLFCLGCLVAGLVPAIAALTICRILMGVGYSAANTANNTASTDVIPVERMAEGIGYFGMSQSVASAIGPALASLVMVAVGNQNSLLTVAAVCGLSLVLALTVGYEKKPGYQKPLPEEGSKGGFLEKTALIPALFQGLFLFIISLPMCFMPLYIVYRGHSAAVAGSFFVVASVVIVGVRLLLSGLMNRLHALWFLIPGFLSLTGLCVMLPLVDSFMGFMAAGFVYGLAHGIIWMILGSEAVRLAAPDRRGAANATFYFAFDAGIGLGASFWGMMIDKVGYDLSLTAVAVAAMILLLVSIPVFRLRSKNA